MENEINSFEMPEKTAEEIIEKIQQLAVDVRNDWTDPKSECRAIYILCDKLKGLWES